MLSSLEVQKARISSSDGGGPCHCVLFASSSEQPGGGDGEADGGFELRMVISRIGALEYPSDKGVKASGKRDAHYRSNRACSSRYSAKVS